jgi:hypothetical protein
MIHLPICFFNSTRLLLDQSGKKHNMYLIIPHHETVHHKPKQFTENTSEKTPSNTKSSLLEQSAEEELQENSIASQVKQQHNTQLAES